MNAPSGQALPQAGARDFLATVWPVSLPTDSESQRRKKLAVRTGHLAMMAMITVAVGASLIADFGEFSPTHLLALCVGAICFMGWNLYGTRGGVRLLLWEGRELPSRSSRMPPPGAIPYFTIQLVLASLIYFLGDRGHSPSLVWLALLPPVAYAVFLLERRGIAIVVTLTTLIFVWSVVRWHGWRAVPYDLLAFSFALVFTLVFTLLAVSSERARGEVLRLAGQLSEANGKLRQYAIQAEELAATRERNRLAREIHDSLGHYLTVVNVQLEAARLLHETDPVRARGALEKAQGLTHEGLREIRRSVAALRLSPLDNQPLTAALQQVVEEGRATGLPLEWQVLGEARTLSPQGELTLYRAGQEGLTNIYKHARSTKAQMVLDFRARDKVLLTVSDNGVGANGTGGTTGFGLLGLRERAQLLGGAVRVRTSPGAGFSLEVEVPG